MYMSHRRRLKRDEGRRLFSLCVLRPTRKAGKPRYLRTFPLVLASSALRRISPSRAETLATVSFPPKSSETCPPQAERCHHNSIHLYRARLPVAAVAPMMHQFSNAASTFRTGCPYPHRDHSPYGRKYEAIHQKNKSWRGLFSCYGSTQ